MSEILARLSPVLVTGVVVAVFFALQRQNPSVRVRLWLAAWVMMLLRFAIFTLPDNFPPPGLTANLLSIAGSAALDLAGILFLVSLTAATVLERKARIGLLATLSLPVIAYTALEVYESRRPWAYAVCVAVLFFGGAGWQIARALRISALRIVIACVIVVVGGICVVEVLRGNLAFSDAAIPTVLFAMSALLFARLYRRWTPGVVTTVCGFGFWAGIWPAIYFLTKSDLAGLAGSDFWNVPKFFVALGLVQTLLEDQSLAARAATDGEHALKVQVESFAAVTSRLLSGVEVQDVCGDIARVLTEATTFERAVVLLAGENGRLFIAGHSGVSPAVLSHLQDVAAASSPEKIAEMCAQATSVGANCFRMHREVARKYGSVSGERRYGENPYWKDGDEILVPLRSRRGTFVGCISLDEPRDPAHTTAAHIAPLDMLATDIAAAYENTHLQRQLLISEKLAGIGQLVSGVTHELNNPLTAVMGYAEILDGHVQDEEGKRYIGVLRRESLRMKGIIENLLRFARQHKPERSLLRLELLIDEVLQLRAYDTRKKGAEITVTIDSALPRISADESQLRQVLLNLLNNALDAVDAAAEK
ncbi:MAG: sensor histidine kinase, partial [Anaerolineae bacterium]